MKKLILSLPWAQWLAVSGANEVSIIKAGNVHIIII